VRENLSLPAGECVAASKAVGEWTPCTSKSPMARQPRAWQCIRLDLDCRPNPRPPGRPQFLNKPRDTSAKYMDIVPHLAAPVLVPFTLPPPPPHPHPHPHGQYPPSMAPGRILHADHPLALAPTAPPPLAPLEEAADDGERRRPAPPPSAPPNPNPDTGGGLGILAALALAHSRAEHYRDRRWDGGSDEAPAREPIVTAFMAKHAAGDLALSAPKLRHLM
jgi:hypothetical protein